MLSKQEEGKAITYTIKRNQVLLAAHIIHIVRPFIL